MHFKSLPYYCCYLAFAVFCSATIESVFAGARNNILTDENTALEEPDESGLEQTLKHNFSPDDRARLRKALSDYAKSSDPSHNRMEQRRKAMRESVEQRFDECNKDNDDSLDLQELAQCLPQVARRFSLVDVDEDGVITLDELELANAKMVERQRAEEAKLEAENIQEAEAAIKDKSKTKVNKQVANVRKRPI